MGFAEKFIASLSSQNLRDDAVHHDLDVIVAAALAGDMGALLCRVKYADGTVSRLFEGNAGNLAQLLRAWTAAVTHKGKARRWVKAHTAWDAQAANTLVPPRRRSVACALARQHMPGLPRHRRGGGRHPGRAGHLQGLPGQRRSTDHLFRRV